MGVGTATVNAYGDTGVSTVSGTSLSTPLVASAVALIIQAHPNWTVPQIRLALFSTATQATSPDTQYYIRGYGIINTLAAINYQQAVPEPSVVMLLVCGAGLLVWHRRR
jgi:subtilisin family serine protease